MSRTIFDTATDKMLEGPSRKDTSMNVILPEYDHVERGLRFGRNVYEGYQRGLATSDRDRLLAITKDASYVQAEKIATDRVLTFPARRANIFLILKNFLPAIPHG